MRVDQAQTAYPLAERMAGSPGQRVPDPSPSQAEPASQPSDPSPVVPDQLAAVPTVPTRHQSAPVGIRFAPEAQKLIDSWNLDGKQSQRLQSLDVLQALDRDGDRTITLAELDLNRDGLHTKKELQSISISTAVHLNATSPW